MQRLDPDGPIGLAPTPLPERIWWERVRRAQRALNRQRPDNRVEMEWGHAVIRVLSSPDELVDGHWTSVPPERRTDEYKRREVRRLNDELGRKLGVGPMPVSAGE